jgi:membrane-associated progesterone receptor component
MLQWVLSATEGNTLYVGAGVAIAVILLVKYLNASADAANARAYEAAKTRQAKAKAEAEKKADIKRRNFTLEELKEFDGENGKPIYIGVLDEVYDVSSKRDFYGPGEGYHLFAGRDASRALAKMSFEKADLDSEDLSDLGFMDQETLQDWVTKFSVYNQYPNVGRIVRQRDLSLEQLKQYNGVDNQRKTVYVALNGNIYDVTLDGWNHYGPDGGYKQFAGRDASRALACMSFLDEYLDNPTLAELDDQQKTTLANWEKKFIEKYPVVGKVVA